VGAADVEVLRTHGFDDTAIHDAIQVIAYFNYINRIAEGVGTDPEPEWPARPASSVDPAHGSRKPM
jgi:hypothetical protein